MCDFLKPKLFFSSLEDYPSDLWQGPRWEPFFYVTCINICLYIGTYTIYTYIL